jgi:DNA repair ATPase RecN
MLKRLALRDFVIVTELEVEFDTGFSVLTGETGAGKSILIDALQLALGSRGDVGLVREGSTRAEVSAEFEDLPVSLQPWLEAAGFDAAGSLLLRRTIDAQGKSRAWINGSPATVGQLREAADHLVEIHGQHAWQRLTRAGDARALLDAQAGVDVARICTHAGRMPRLRCSARATRATRSSANASGWPGRSTSSTGWRPAPPSGTSSTMSTAGCRMRRRSSTRRAQRSTVCRRPTAVRSNKPTARWPRYSRSRATTRR